MSLADFIAYQTEPTIDMLIRQATLADAPAIGQIHMDSWRNTYRGLVSDSFLDNLKLEERVGRWQHGLAAEESGEFAYVAENEAGQVIGFATGGPSRAPQFGYSGELWALHITLPYQRSGLGRKLVSVVAKRLRDLGHDSMLVWVLTENSARQFYEKLGGVHIADHVEEWADGLVAEVAYGYSDLSTLILD